MEKKIGEFEKRMREMSTMPTLDDFLELVREAKKEFLSLEQKASDKAGKDVDSRLDGGTGFVASFRGHSIRYIVTWFEEWFINGKKE